MNFAKTAATATALCLMLGAGAAYAQPAEPANETGCLHMAKKVTAALEANPQSPNLSAAQDQAWRARGYCAQRLYQSGVEHYSRALEALGVS